jgi:hypothetical protein
VRLKPLFIIMDPPTMPYTPQRQYAMASSVCQILEVY